MPRMSVRKPGVSSSAPPKIDEHAVGDLAGGTRPRRERLVEAPPRRAALRAHEHRAEHRVGDQERDRPPDADRLADLDDHRSSAIGTTMNSATSSSSGMAP